MHLPGSVSYMYDPCVVKIDEAALEVRHIQLLPAISNELNQSIVHHNAKFPIRRRSQKFHDWQWTSIKRFVSSLEWSPLKLSIVLITEIRSYFNLSISETL